MIFIVWGIIAALFGVGLGYLGSFYSKMAYSIFAIFLGIVTFFSSYIVDMVGGDSMAVSALQMEASQNTDAGLWDHFMTAVAAINVLPRHVQIAFILFALTFLVSQFLLFIYRSHQSKQAVETIRRT